MKFESNLKYARELGWLETLYRNQLLELSEYMKIKDALKKKYEKGEELEK